MSGKIDEIEARIDKLCLRYSSKELETMGGRESLRKAAEQQVKFFKPEGCTCQYPDIICRNMNGHAPECPTYIRWKQDYFSEPNESPCSCVAPELNGHKEECPIYERQMETKAQSLSHCPTCGHPLKVEAHRICANCKKPILSHHKYRFKTEGGKTFLIHRHCDNPYSYQPKETK